ncbi:MAG: alkyl/aryl-sulfatase [Pseudomonadota bacterium]
MMINAGIARTVAAIGGAIASFGIVLAPSELAAESEATQRLKERNAEFEKDIIRVSYSVYTAVGYGVSTVSMIEGTDGVVIVDTGIDAISGAEIREDFRDIVDKPIKAIIFTHGHGDHIGGVSAFVDSPETEIWARDGFGHEQRFLESAGIRIQTRRGAMQAGFMLSPEQRINNGVARAYWPRRGAGVFEKGQKIPPTHFHKDGRHRLEVAGLELDLVATGGETQDHLYVWFPDEKIAFTGDNFYKSWPNLYAIRGTEYRNILHWIDAIDNVLAEEPSAVVGGHTRPIVDAKDARKTLTNYRDAIEFVFMKTVEGINKGMTPNQLVEYVELPNKFQKLDYLQPYYGNPEWAIRAIFSGYLGWFDGNATNLFPLSDVEEAKRLADLAGGVDALVQKTTEALAEDDNQWAAQLSDHVLAIEPDNETALSVKAEALTALAETKLTATARNYYLSTAIQLRKRVNEGDSSAPSD